MRSLPRRWNGWKSRSTSSCDTERPELATVRTADPSSALGSKVDGSFGDVVVNGVFHQVGDHPLDEGAIAGEGGRFDRGRHL